MANSSSIEWTEATWNPTTGCSKISSGCKNCYAEKLSKRLNAMGVKKYKNIFKFTEQPQDLELPLSWKKPKKSLSIACQIFFMKILEWSL